MNRKLTLLLIAAVATILPAVAVADVMVTGQATLESFHQHTAFEFERGSNYPAANATNSIGWMPLDGNWMGQIDLQGSDYVQTEMINVIDLNMTISNAAAPSSVTELFLNMSSSSFPAGTIMVIATSSLTFAILEGTAVSTYSGTPIALNAASASAVVAVDLSQNPHIVINNPVPTQTFYIGFILPPGQYAGASAIMTGQFVKLA